MSRKKAKKNVLNVHLKSSKEEGRILCPFADAPFAHDHVSVRSMEGFANAIRFPPMDRRRIIALMESAREAQRVGNKADDKYVWWNNQRYVYGSLSHHLCIEQMIRARLRQDLIAQEALIATQGRELIHRPPKHSSVRSIIPPKLLCGTLMQARHELIVTGSVGKH